MFPLTSLNREGGRPMAMTGLKKKRRIQVVALAALALTLSTVLIGYAMRDGINFFRAPSIGGLVEEGSIVRGQGEEIRFSVTDGGATVPVVYTGVLPDLFEENQGMVGTGNYVSGVFQATEILAKHDETYMPAEVVDALKAQGVYVNPKDVDS
jgi:cytochrome c-type biogenesis protein CcmE